MTTRRDFLQVSGAAAGCAFLPAALGGVPTALQPHPRRLVTFITHDMVAPPVPPIGTLVASDCEQYLFTVEQHLPIQTEIDWARCAVPFQFGVAEVVAVSVGAEYEDCWINKVVGPHPYVRVSDTYAQLYHNINSNHIAYLSSDLNLNGKVDCYGISFEADRGVVSAILCEKASCWTFGSGAIC